METLKPGGKLKKITYSSLDNCSNEHFIPKTQMEGNYARWDKRIVKILKKWLQPRNRELDCATVKSLRKFR